MNIVVVQGYDKANQMSQSQIPAVILNNIEKEIPDENVYFISEIGRASCRERVYVLV